MNQTATGLSCWKCGAPLIDVLLPLARLAQCKQCNADLHVCRMCKFYDTTVSNSCREPIAEKVTDKRRKNFCGYFQPDQNAFQAGAKPSSATNELNALFGIETKPAGPATEEDEAKRKLNELFGLGKKE